MSCKNNSSLFFNKAYLAAAMIIALLVSIRIYVHYKKKIDHANHLRHTLYQLAKQLRQSSDDLTRSLANADCHAYQGSLFCQPIPLADFEQFTHHNLKQH